MRRWAGAAGTVPIDIERGRRRRRRACPRSVRTRQTTQPGRSTVSGRSSSSNAPHVCGLANEALATAIERQQQFAERQLRLLRERRLQPSRHRVRRHVPASLTITPRSGRADLQEQPEEAAVFSIRARARRAFRFTDKHLTFKRLFQAAASRSSPSRSATPTDTQPVQQVPRSNPTRTGLHARLQTIRGRRVRRHAFRQRHRRVLQLRRRVHAGFVGLRHLQAERRTGRLIGLGGAAFRGELGLNSTSGCELQPLQPVTKDSRRSLARQLTELVPL